MGSYLDEYPQSSHSTMYLAYQNAEEYPELLEDLQNTISQRNKSRVQHTMRQFEYLSRHNKNMDKPLFVDDEQNYHENECHRCCRRHGNNCQVCEYCPSFYESRRVFETKQPNSDYRSHRSRRCSESINRTVDPSWSDSQLRCGASRSHSNSRWHMDPRNGSWVKMYDNGYDIREYPQYHEYNCQNYSSKMLPSKLHQYLNAQRHRSGSRRRSHERNICTCHHCNEYRN